MDRKPIFSFVFRIRTPAGAESARVRHGLEDHSRALVAAVACAVVADHFGCEGPGLAQKVREFGTGLKTIHGPWSLLWLALLSLIIWYVTALAYKEVTHSYGVDALEIPVSQLLILMGASMAGSMLQLPAVGGGSQITTIATLSAVFDVPPEMAASCGILLWLVTFAAVVPVGL